VSDEDIQELTASLGDERSLFNKFSEILQRAHPEMLEEVNRVFK